MFLAHDRMELREQTVRHYCGAGKKPEPGILLLLAAVNLEWTVCRAVRHLYLSSPRAELSNSELQTRIKGCSGLKKYKELWENEVMHVRECLQLDQIIPFGRRSVRHSRPDTLLCTVAAVIIPKRQRVRISKFYFRPLGALMHFARKWVFHCIGPYLKRGENRLTQGCSAGRG